jgi:AAA domain, putative AbiEii toxin, Type IV TA system
MQKYTRYDEILLPPEAPFSSYSAGERNEIGLLSLINIFIGANNSGKSRLLRSLFSLNNFLYNTNRYKAKPFYDLIQATNKELEAAFPDGISSIGNISRNHLKNILDGNPHFISSTDPIHKKVEDALNALSSTHSGNMGYRGEPPSVNPDDLAKRIREIGFNAMERFKEIEFDPEIGDEKRYYIPILRGMRPLDDAHTNLYKNRTLDDYFQTTLAENMEIFTGLELYQTLKEKLLGEPEDREAVKNFEDFLSKKFFSSRQITLIPREGDTTVHIKIGNEKQLPIYQLGDGLQGLIICTFNIFIEKARCVFFIEEPDMFMHPSLQRSFLEVLSEFDQHQYFITSHSNHFLDMTIDFANISVFHFSKIEGTESRFNIRTASSRDRRILLDLGVQNSSVFLTNATIWIEGLTDRLYLRAYMEKYISELQDSESEQQRVLNNLKEDYHYSFIEYQGANLTHWSFDPNDEDMKRIKANYVCAHAFLIADGDVATKGEREKLYSEMLEERFYILKVKEIENLIPLEVLKKIVTKKFEENDKDTELMRYEDYSKEDIPIGKYLDSLLSLSKGKTVFSAESGTIKSKVTFCEKAVEIMGDPEFNWNLTQELKDICSKLFEHIITENRSQDVAV